MFDLVIQTPSRDAIYRSLLARYSPENVDMRPLADEVASIILADHHDAIAAGEDRHGERLADISPETVKRRARRGDGAGPPLAPNAPSGRIADMLIDVSEESPGVMLIRGTWPEAPFLRFHTEGVPGRLPQRDIVGVRPETWGKIRDAVNRFAAGLIRGDV